MAVEPKVKILMDIAYIKSDDLNSLVFKKHNDLIIKPLLEGLILLQDVFSVRPELEEILKNNYQVRNYYFRPVNYKRFRGEQNKPYLLDYLGQFSNEIIYEEFFSNQWSVEQYEGIDTDILYRLFKRIYLSDRFQTLKTFRHPDFTRPYIYTLMENDEEVPELLETFCQNAFINYSEFRETDGLSARTLELFISTPVLKKYIMETTSIIRTFGMNNTPLFKQQLTVLLENIPLVDAQLRKEQRKRDKCVITDELFYNSVFFKAFQKSINPYLNNVSLQKIWEVKLGQYRVENNLKPPR